MKSLLLDTRDWDLVKDASGNIAIASAPYSIAQDVATTCRTFLGECWYNLDLGIPYFQQILGKFPPLVIIKNFLTKAASEVPGCNKPKVFITGFKRRTITGNIQFTDAFGVVRVIPLTLDQERFILGQSSLGGTNVI